MSSTVCGRGKDVKICKKKYSDTSFIDIPIIKR